MKILYGRYVGLLFAVAMFAADGVHAQNNPTITVNENGVGTAAFLGGPVIPLTGVLAADPGPDGLALALTYTFGSVVLTAGDVGLLDPITGLLSDAIRFNAAGTGDDPGYLASLVFYSDSSDGADALADTGFPGSAYANSVLLQEIGFEDGANGITYTPSIGQPGFVDGSSITYVIISDTATAVPEPATLGLIGAGVLGLLGYTRRRKATN